jgi:hypothetical protein
MIDDDRLDPSRGRRPDLLDAGDPAVERDEQLDPLRGEPPEGSPRGARWR